MSSAPDAPVAPSRLTPEASAALGARVSDVSRVATLRDAGATASTTLAMPTRIERPWKYTDVSGLDLHPYGPSSNRPEGRIERADFGISNDVAGLLLQIDGVTVTAEATAAGLTIEDFVDAPGEELQRAGTVVTPEADRFAALHYAFLQGGVLVHVAANTEIDAPVHIVRDYREDRQLAAPHTLIVTGANSHVTVVEDLRSADADILAVPVAEILPGPGAQVRYIVLHNWGEQTRVYGRQRAVTDQASEFLNLHVVAGGDTVKYQIESSLEGRGSSSELFAVGVGSGKHRADFNTVQDHIAADTRSDLLFKSALQDHSQSIYYGITRVGLGARNADANQQNRNLLLSKHAKADSDPVLEILTNDIIRCAHGATVGPVDEEQLFYMQSRGLTKPAAVSLLVRGFLGDVLVKSRLDEGLRDSITDLLESKLQAKLGAAVS